MIQVIIICSDPDFRDAYSSYLANLIGGANVLSLESIDKLQAFEIPNKIQLTVLDGYSVPSSLRTLDDVPVLKNVLDITDLILILNANLPINCLSNIKLRYPDSISKSIYVPEKILENMISPIRIKNSGAPKTYERSIPQVRYISQKPNLSIELDENVQKQIKFLKMAIHEDPDILINGFVRKTSEIKLPETISDRLPKLVDIENAVTHIEVFLQIAKGKSYGLIILGEKGVGKTTLTNYAAELHTMKHSNFIFLPIDYQWIPIFEIEYEINDLAEGFFKISGVQETNDPDKLLPILNDMIAHDKWINFGTLSLSHRNRLFFYEHDDTFIVDMYCHFNKQMVELNKMLATSGYPTTELIDKAHEWIATIRDEPRKMILFCLTFFLEKGKANFMQFSWESILRSIIRLSKRNEMIKVILKQNLPESLKQRFEDGRLDPIDILPALKRLGTTITYFGTNLLQEITKTFKILLFIDNIDARYDIFLETRLIRYSISFMQTIISSVPCDTILCIRNSTYTSPLFTQMDIQEIRRWDSMQIRPPDLGSLLERRVEQIRDSGEFIGTSGWWFSDFLYDWVIGMIKKDIPRDFLDIIEQRHPNNVRGQLDLFCTAATSTVLHHQRTRLGTISDITSWADVSPEFCQRALIWGKQTYYSESNIVEKFVPNIYDNRNPKSLFNALLRSLVLDWIYRQKESFSINELVQTFTGLGVSQDEVESAIENARDFDIIRETYDERDERSGASEWVMTKWGKFFYIKIAFDLPYIQTIWWDVPMLEGFSVGKPKLLDWTELRQPSETFERWIRVEESIVREHIGNDFHFSISNKISTNITKAINNINKSLHHI